MATSKIMIKGGRVVDPTQGIDRVTNLYISGKKVEKIGGKTSKGYKVIEADGLYVMPGLVDMHTHLREPGREDKETVISGANAAVAGGFTSIACMANTQPPIDNAEVVKYVIEKAGKAACHVYPVAAVSKGMEGNELTEMGDILKAGAVAFSDDGVPVKNGELLRNALEYLKMFGVPVLLHEEDMSLSHDGVMNEGPVATLLGLTGIPSVSETSMIARDLVIAEYIGGKVHFCHLSAADSARLVKDARARGVKVTCEVTPHHLVLSDDIVKEMEYDTNTKVNPPVRSRDDRKALQKALISGTIDCIATDHAPHAPEDKDKEYNYAPFGMTGLETAVGVVFTELVNPKKLTVKEFVTRASVNPAKILQIPGGTLKPGSAADVTVIDPGKEWVVKTAAFKSKSNNSPFIGNKLKGKVILTIVDGFVKYSEL
ncbi:dihydroorotase [bacterium]|nr:dihydroorotase [bacterium]